MSRKERIKTALDLLKSLLMTFLVGLFGITGYTFVHFEELTKTKVGLIILTLIGVIFSIAVITKWILKKLDELEKED